MVSDNPETFADLDGHELFGVATAVASVAAQFEDDDGEGESRPEPTKPPEERFEDEHIEPREVAEAKKDEAMQEAFFKKNGISDLSVTLNPMLPCENAPADSPEPAAKSSEPWMLKAGKEAHENEEVRPGEEKEVRTPSGQRMDRYNKEDAHIREIKPNNARGEKSGNAQLQRYKNEMDKATGRSHTTELTKYPPRQQ